MIAGAFRSLLFAACLMLAGCQSATVDEALDVNGGKADPVAAGIETVGAGPVTIGMIVSPGQATVRDLRDGAKLAAMQLGGDQVTLAIHGGGPKAGVEALAARNARIIIGPSGAREAGVVAAIAQQARPPVVALVANDVSRGPDMFAFISDETDSAIEAAAYAAGSGRKKIVLLHPPGQEQAMLARLRRNIEAKGGRITAALPFSSRASGGLASQVAALKQADALLLGPGLEAPAAALAAVRATGALAPNAMILGTAGLSAQRGLAGTLICRVDQAAVADVAERYRTEFGRAMTRNAAYGFDAVALAIGIARSRGADALDASTLRASAGFRGLLGAFRFKATGEVERNCSIYRLTDDKLELQDPAPNGF
ncbi:ABC transporter substrate-binding protein [Nitratireductor pacificus]|uniref:Extracellular ligand-binding receptor n=1 Tax=Nitratireductor pacificus pht-3B TaxID=391937 RepID=K2MI81_9HYPH|nr:ABC transporter substrate-binding protein [Nitratireductor pacificus]EKF20425.1 Extracellular ligand-binding receptor [Nitratireductor pacificus pht-3B]